MDSEFRGNTASEPPPPPGAESRPSMSSSRRHASNLSGNGRKRGPGCLFALLLIGACAFAVVAAAVVGVLWLGTALEGEAGLLSSASGSRLHEEPVDAFPGLSAEKIAVIDIKGIIVGSARFDAAGVQTVSRQLAAAAADADVVAVVLDMDTPGGEVTASDEMHHAVQRLRRTGKPVVTCMHGLGASGGYLVAAGTDYIVANRLTLTGSIGVIAGTLNYAGLFDKIGLEMEIYKSGEMKDFLSGGRARTVAEKELVQNLVNANFDVFARIVAAGRGEFESAAAVKRASFADGRILSGKEALDLGLVDAVGYFEDAVVKARELAGAPGAGVVRYRRAFRLTDVLFRAVQRSRPAGLDLLPAEARLIEPGRLYFIVPGLLP